MAIANLSAHAESINRRTVLKSTGALASVAALGVSGQTIAKATAFDPGRYIRERKAMGYRDVLVIEANGNRIRWFQLPMVYSNEIERRAGQLEAERMDDPNGRARLLDYMEAHCEIVRYEA